MLCCDGAIHLLSLRPHITSCPWDPEQGLAEEGSVYVVPEDAWRGFDSMSGRVVVLCASSADGNSPSGSPCSEVLILSLEKGIWTATRIPLPTWLGRADVEWSHQGVAFSPDNRWLLLEVRASAEGKDRYMLLIDTRSGRVTDRIVLGDRGKVVFGWDASSTRIFIWPAPVADEEIVPTVGVYRVSADGTLGRAQTLSLPLPGRPVAIVPGIGQVDLVAVTRSWDPEEDDAEFSVTALCCPCEGEATAKWAHCFPTRMSAGSPGVWRGPDGASLLCTSDGALWLLRTEDGSVRLAQLAHRGDVVSVAWSSPASAVTVSIDGTAVLWDFGAAGCATAFNS